MYGSASFVRSKIQSTDQLLRLSGLLQIHTSSVREKGEKQEQDDDREKEEEDDDERDRMLSALKTAVGFLAVPLLIMLIYGGFGSGGSSGGAVIKSLEIMWQPHGVCKMVNFPNALIISGCRLLMAYLLQM